MDFIQLYYRLALLSSFPSTAEINNMKFNPEIFALKRLLPFSKKKRKTKNVEALNALTKG